MYSNILSVRSLLLTVAILGTAGCHGPSKAGLEARENAYNRIDKVNTQIAFGQAQQAFEVGNLREGLEIITEAVVRYPEAAEYHLLKGRILMEMGRLDEARIALEGAAEQNDQLSEPWYFLGIVYQRWSEDEQSHVHYMHAADLEPNRPQFLLASAEMLVAMKRYEEADGLLISRIRKFEHHPAMRHLLGQIAALRGDMAKAVQYYEEASLLQPEDMHLLSELAHMQFMAGNVPECLTVIERIEYSGHALDRNLHRTKARCLMHARRELEARPIYKQLLASREHDVMLWEEAGLLAWSIEDWRGLKNCGQRVSALASDHASGWTMLAVAHRSEGRYDEAEASLLKAVACEDADALCWVLLANLRERNGDLTGSMKAWQSATDLDDSLSGPSRLADGASSGG